VIGTVLNGVKAASAPQEEESHLLDVNGTAPERILFEFSVIDLSASAEATPHPQPDEPPKQGAEEPLVDFFDVSLLGCDGTDSAAMEPTEEPKSEEQSYLPDILDATFDDDKASPADDQPPLNLDVEQPPLHLDVEQLLLPDILDATLTGTPSSRRIVERHTAVL
jgi:hypothetical protein